MEEFRGLKFPVGGGHGHRSFKNIQIQLLLIFIVVPSSGIGSRQFKGFFGLEAWPCASALGALGAQAPLNQFGLDKLHLYSHLPSDTKLLLTKNDSEIIIFQELRISRVIP